MAFLRLFLPFPTRLCASARGRADSIGPKNYSLHSPFALFAAYFYPSAHPVNSVKSLASRASHAENHHFCSFSANLGQFQAFPLYFQPLFPLFCSQIRFVAHGQYGDSATGDKSPLQKSIREIRAIRSCLPGSFSSPPHPFHALRAFRSLSRPLSLSVLFTIFLDILFALLLRIT